MTKGRIIALLLGLGAAAACGRSDAASVPARATSAAAAPAVPNAGVVDSDLPPDELLRRFRADIATRPTEYAHAEDTREKLVRRYVRALAAGDSATMAELLMTRAEFAYLYYPESPYAKNPTVIPPGFMWMQQSGATNRGYERALRYFRQRPSTYVSHTCEGAPQRWGDNTIWGPCLVRVATAHGDTTDLSLFGAIVERHGRFKFASYANKL